MKLKLEATAQELLEHTVESLTHRIERVASDIARGALDDGLRKAERADTPAEPHERIKGSERNPSGSARSVSSGAGIQLSDAVISALKEDVREHNENASQEWQRVTLAQLKAVWRRGAGAFSVSHRPSQNRQSWAFARVKSFRDIVMGGGNPKYVQDDDLLDAKHPRRRTEKAQCGTIMHKSISRGGEVDLVVELAERMRDRYLERLEELSIELAKITKDQ